MKHPPCFAKKMRGTCKLIRIIKTVTGSRLIQAMRWEFGSVCFIEESTGPQNLRVSIVLKSSKSGGAKVQGVTHSL